MTSFAIRPLPPLVETLLRPKYRHLYKPALFGGPGMNAYEDDDSDTDSDISSSEEDVDILDMDPSNNIPIVKLHACVVCTTSGCASTVVCTPQRHIVLRASLPWPRCIPY